MNRRQLETKLSLVTTKLLQEKGYIAFIDVFMELAALDPKEHENWRMRRVPYLEKVITMNLSKISFIMKTVDELLVYGVRQGKPGMCLVIR